MRHLDIPKDSVMDLHLKHVAGDEVEVIYTMVDPRSYQPTDERLSVRSTAREVFSTFPVTLAHQAKVRAGILAGRVEHLTRTTF